MHGQTHTQMDIHTYISIYIYMYMYIYVWIYAIYISIIRCCYFVNQCSSVSYPPTTINAIFYGYSTESIILGPFSK